MCWGGVAILLGRHALRDTIWVGAMASPVIGLVIGLTTQPVFERFIRWRRSAVALCSLYCGGALFALSMGLYEAITNAVPERDRLGMVIEMQMVVAWGITLFVIALWPLAYFTHFLIELGDRN
jgi:hypothetical protein